MKSSKSLLLYVHTDDKGLAVEVFVESLLLYVHRDCQRRVAEVFEFIVAFLTQRLLGTDS